MLNRWLSMLKIVGQLYVGLDHCPYVYSMQMPIVHLSCHNHTYILLHLITSLQSNYPLHTCAKLTCALFQMMITNITGVSLSEPHTSKTALQDVCVCLSVCLHVAYTENFN